MAKPFFHNKGNTALATLIPAYFAFRSALVISTVLRRYFDAFIVLK